MCRQPRPALGGGSAEGIVASFAPRGGVVCKQRVLAPAAGTTTLLEGRVVVPLEP